MSPTNIRLGWKFLPAINTPADHAAEAKLTFESFNLTIELGLK